VPLTRPAEISNGVSLSDKLGRAVSVGRFVSEDGAVDAFLFRDRVVNELSPDEHGVSVSSAENNVFPRADELAPSPAIRVAVAAVVPFIEFEAGDIAIFRHVPEWFHFPQC
jgi:hypothetical protein